VLDPRSNLRWTDPRVTGWTRGCGAERVEERRAAAVAGRDVHDRKAAPRPGRVMRLWRALRHR